MSSSPAYRWINQLYRYVEYYYWEPQHLYKQAIPGRTGKEALKKVQENMRKLEVPLNTIFNISLRLLPNRIINNILNCFFNNTLRNFGQPIELINFEPLIADLGNFSQPDITLESDTSRIFVEIKLDSYLQLQQVYKYLFIHALWNVRTGIQKQPYLFFLSHKEIARQWTAKERRLIFSQGTSIDNLLIFLKTQPLPDIVSGVPVQYLHQEVNAILDSLVLGSTTWQNIGDILQDELTRQKSEYLNDGSEVIYKLIEDLLTELNNRKLWFHSLKLDPGSGSSDQPR